MKGDGLQDLLIWWPRVFIKDTGHFQTGQAHYKFQFWFHASKAAASSKDECLVFQAGTVKEGMISHHSLEGEELHLTDHAATCWTDSRVRLSPVDPAHSWEWDYASPMQMGTLVHSYTAIPKWWLTNNIFIVLKVWKSNIKKPADVISSGSTN